MTAQTCIDSRRSFDFLTIGSCYLHLIVKSMSRLCSDTVGAFNKEDAS
jgi:hypothetical protein